jgi:RNA polymerase sigma factor, sigma-70 family
MKSIDKNKDKLESNAEDIATVAAILNGQHQFFGKIQKKYKRMITAVIRRVVSNELDIEDLVQETFIKAYNALGSYDQRYSFSSWLVKIATNHAIDFLRKRKLETISISTHSIENDEDDFIIQIPDTNLLPDQNLSQKELANTIQSILEKMPENFRQIIILRFQQEMDYNEIAQKLSIPLGTVKATLFRAKKMLSALLVKNKLHK